MAARVNARAAELASLRPLREARGLSLREVARRAGISAAALSDAERGSWCISRETAARVLAVLASEGQP